MATYDFIFDWLGLPVVLSSGEQRRHERLWRSFWRKHGRRALSA
jgi:hypothetical protein